MPNVKGNIPSSPLTHTTSLHCILYQYFNTKLRGNQHSKVYTIPNKIIQSFEFSSPLNQIHVKGQMCKVAKPLHYSEITVTGGDQNSPGSGS
jgi:hypothetical protein